MGFLQGAVLVVHILGALGICVFVLLQHGKGADMGAAFGSGSAGSVFGAAGSANFLSRTTAVLAAVFFVTSISLTYFATRPAGSAGGGGLMDRVTTEPAKTAPAPSGPASGIPAPAAKDAAVPGATPPKAADGAAAPAAPAGTPSKASEVPK